MKKLLTFIREKYHPLLRLRRMSWFRRFQSRVDFPVRIRNGEIRQRIYWLRDLGFLLLRERLEEQTADCLERLLKEMRPHLFVDIGANVGFYSWRVRQLSPATEVWMFEPDISNIRLLRTTIADNSLENITLFPWAVSDACGRIDFLVDEISGKTGSIISQAHKVGSLHNDYGLQISSTIECRSLDSMPEWRDKTDVLMKIDVEGAEEKVLAGAIGILQKLRPVVIIECFDTRRLEFLSSLAYLVIDLQEKGNYLLVPEEQTNLLNIFKQRRST